MIYALIVKVCEKEYNGMPAIIKTSVGNYPSIKEGFDCKELCRFMDSVYDIDIFVKSVRDVSLCDELKIKKAIDKRVKEIEDMPINEIWKSNREFIYKFELENLEDYYEIGY